MNTIDIQWFKDMEYDEQLETLRKLWDEDNLDMYYELLNVYPEQSRIRVEQEVELDLSAPMCAYDEVVDFSYKN